MKKKVKTIKSEILPIELCRKIEGEYYKIGNRNIENSGDCYEINGRFYKDNTGYIIFDHFNRQYEIYNSEKFKKGIVGLEKDKETLIIGYFQDNDLSCILKGKSGHLFEVMTYFLLDNSKYKLNRFQNKYIHIDNYSILDSLNYRAVNHNFKRSLNYNITNNIIKECEEYSEAYKDKLPTYDIAKPLSEYLKGLSFGVEFETTKGTIPQKYCFANKLVSLRDGSIEGLEYVSLPLQNEEGINNIINITKLLNNYTTFDNSCSLHMHIGNVPRTESFLLALFKVLCNVEDDFYKMFPLYKKINGGFKKKNYTSPLPAVKLLTKMDSVITKDNIVNNFDILFKYLSNGISYREYNNNLNNVHSHPYDPDNNRKWNVASRYHWVNLIPLIFGNKQTIEFRIHTPAKDPNKILMFLLLISKVINFVKDNEKNILENKFNNIDLNIILSTVNNSELLFEKKLNIYILKYVNSRINFTNNMFYSKNFNYDEKEFKYMESINFINNNNTNFLFNKKDKNSILDYCFDSQINNARNIFESTLANNNITTGQSEEVSEEVSEESLSIEEW